MVGFLCSNVMRLKRIRASRSSIHPIGMGRHNSGVCFFDEERTDYTISIRNQVGVPFTLYIP